MPCEYILLNTKASIYSIFFFFGGGGGRGIQLGFLCSAVRKKLVFIPVFLYISWFSKHHNKAKTLDCFLSLKCRTYKDYIVASQMNLLFTLVKINFIRQPTTSKQLTLQLEIPLLNVLLNYLNVTTPHIYFRL